MNENMTNTFEEEEDEATTVTLTYEDGTEEECIVLDIFQVEELGEQEYIALLSLPEGYEETDEEELETEVFIYRYKELEDGEISLDPIEDDAETATVQAAFEVLLEESAEEEE